jgi:hypothetical protein
MTSPHPDTKLPENTVETLRLKCPTCGGGLNLKRRHLGITGQCVHCRTPLTALEKNGSVQVVAGLDPHFPAEVPAEVPGTAATPPAPTAPAAVEAMPSFDSPLAATTIPVATHHAPALETPAPPASAWGFPDRESAPAFSFPAATAPQSTAVQDEIPASVLASIEPTPSPAGFPDAPAKTVNEAFAAPAPFQETATPSFDPISPANTNLFGTTIEPAASPFATADPSPTSFAPVSSAQEDHPFPAMTTGFSFNGSSPETSNLLVDRNEIPLPAAGGAPSFAPSALFGNQQAAGESFSSMFKSGDDSSQINPAWGTKVPQESHASISPFATGSASGGGYAESLFREKVEKESAKIESPLFAKKEDSSPIAPAAKEEFQKKVVLDGDGRPMKPMTPEEEANFAKHLFAVEKTHKRPRWVKKLIKTSITFAILGAIGTGGYFLTPQEKLAEWKEKAYIWLEPGLAILDYLPEGLRPDWLPRTSLGIDAGVDENGVPKKKLNAFEALEKLKGDIGNMRGTAEEELENINKL